MNNDSSIQHKVLRDIVMTAVCVITLYLFPIPAASALPPVFDPIPDKVVAEGSALTFDVSAVDADNDTITYGAADLPSGATFSGNTFTWTPDYTQAGTYTITLTADDGNGGIDTKGVNITVTDNNRVPIVQDLAVYTDEDIAVAVTLTGSDADGDPLVYRVTSGPQHGTVSGSAPGLTYAPAADYNGTDTFTYAANDGKGDSIEGTVTVTVRREGVALKVKPGFLPIYDGEPGSYTTPNSQYVIQSPGEGLDGSVGLLLTPDNWHSPAIKLQSPAYRSNFMLYDALEFYFRSPSADPGDPTIRLNKWPGMNSNTLPIKQYIEGGVIDNTYRLVHIPLSDFVTDTWDLAGGETIYFNLDPLKRTYYVDKMQLRDTTPLHIESITVETEHIIRITTDGRYDLSASRIRSNYLLASADDPAYAAGAVPLDTGAHIRYLGHEPGADITNPTNRYDILLYFRDALKEGGLYTLSVNGINDTAGNALVPVSFDFTYTDDRTVPFIKINQEGYIPGHPKHGYVGWYFGDLGGGAWAVGEEGLIFSYDKELGWQRMASPVTTTLRAVAATREDDIWAVGDGGTIVHYDGTAWSQVASPTGQDLYGISFSMTNSGWAVGANGTIIRYRDGAWENVTSPVSVTLRSVWFGSDNDGVAVGNSGTIIRYDGTTWKSSKTITTEDLYAVAGRKGFGVQTIVGARGTIIVDQWGLKIAASSGMVDVTLRGLAINPNRPPANTYAAGDNGTLLSINRDGLTYKVESSGTTETLHSVAFLENRQWWAAGTNGAMVSVTDKGIGTQSLDDATILAVTAVPFGEMRLPKVTPEIEIRDAGTGHTVRRIPLVLQAANYFLSGEDVYTFDFSDITASGTYRAYLKGYGYSYPFTIGPAALNKTAYHTSRVFYYDRSGQPLETPYSDPRFVRTMDHDASIDAAFHESLLDSPLYNGETVCPLIIKDRAAVPAASMVDMTGGWFDAGDYGKYVTSACAPVWRLLTAYEIAPNKFKEDWNIPESGNGIPDILDEAKWEIDFLVKMQAPDGGVYNKVVAQTWEAGTPEASDIGGYPVRYIMAKTTGDTALAGAIYANAARVWKRFDKALSLEYLRRAELAWEFLKQHPTQVPVGGYQVPAGHHSGPYPDPEDIDNRAWLAAELYRTTGKTEYREYYETLYNTSTLVSGWGWNDFQHSGKEGQWAYLRSTWPDVNESTRTSIRNTFIKNSEDLRKKTEASVYRVSARHDVPEWVGWGTLGQNTCESYILLLGWFVSGDQRFYDAACINADIVLGANPLSTSFISGVGTVYPKDPLHNQSRFDNVDDPIPGIHVFGAYAHATFSNAWYAEAQSDRNNYPSIEQVGEPYPVFRRWADENTQVGYNEFGIGSQTATAAVFNILRGDTAPNEPPVAQPDTIKTTKDTAVPVTLNASDEEVAPLTYTITSGPSHGTLSGIAPELIYTPDTDYSGTDSFSFKVHDGYTDSNVAVISLAVGMENAPPVAYSLSLTMTGNEPRPLILSASDADGDTLSYIIVADPRHGSLSGTAPDLTYIPDTGYEGSDTFTYKANDGADDSNIATVSVTISAMNGLPDLSGIPSTLVKNEADTITCAELEKATDIDGDALTYTYSDWVTMLPYTTTYTDSGTHIIRVEVSDGTGSVSKDIEVTVNNINRAPSASDRSVSTARNTAKAVALGAADDDNDPLVYTIVSDPGHGSLTGTPPDITYTPAVDYSGTDSFTFKANDGLDDSNTATVSITVIGEKVHYVDANSGNDANDGLSEGTPWKTIQKAATAMPAGSTCLVSAGTYTERVAVNKSGLSAASPTVFRAAGPGAVVNGGFTVKRSSGVISYIVIDGFEITNPAADDELNGSGITLFDAQSCEALNNYIHDTVWPGIQLDTWSGSASNNLSNNKITNNRIVRAGTYCGILVKGRNNRVEKNDISGVVQNPLWPIISTVDGSDADGIKVEGIGHIFKDNYIHDIRFSDPGNSNIAGAPHIDGIQLCETGSNLTFDKNRIILLDPGPSGNTEMCTQGIYIDAPGTVQNVTITNNVIQVIQPINLITVKNATIEHNTLIPGTSPVVWDNTRTPHGIEINGCSGTIKVKNNIIYGNWNLTNHYYLTVDGSQPVMDVGYNAYFRIKGTRGASAVNDKNTDPKFVLIPSGDRDPWDLHLQSTSPLIDAGIALSEITDDLDSNTRPHGAGFDIGAYEYVDTVSSAYPLPLFIGRLNAAGKNSMAIDFGSEYGTWIRYDDGTWAGLSIMSPEIMTGADTDANGIDDLVIDFGPSCGIWLYMNNASWEELNSLDSEAITTGRFDDDDFDDIAIDFGQDHGIWVKHGDGTWEMISDISSESMVAGDVNGNGKDEIVIDFGQEYGIWVRHDDGTWDLISVVDPECLASGDIDGDSKAEVIIDFGPNHGIWVRHDDGTWDLISVVDPECLASGDIDGDSKAEIIIDFGPNYGIWVRHDDGTWDLISVVDPECLASGDIDGDSKAEIIIDFGPNHGIWARHDDGTWDLVSGVSPDLMAAGDLDGDGKDDLVIDFGTENGIWLKYGNGDWERLHDLSP
ncbi:MAG: Ig-like domain-containing protein [Candidatus Omnitrophota bacterium]